MRSTCGAVLRACAVACLLVAAVGWRSSDFVSVTMHREYGRFPRAQYRLPEPDPYSLEEAERRLLKQESVPAFGDVWPVGIFYVFMDIGTPSRKFPVALDTGSMTLDVRGESCQGCPTHKPNNGYDPKASSTSERAFPFFFSNSYQTCDLKDPEKVCTIQGPMYSDMVSIGDFEPVRVKFGSIMKQTKDFDQFSKICGVVGLAGGNGKDSVLETMRLYGRFSRDMFGLCLNEHGTKGNGTFTLGGIDDRLHEGEFAWAKNVPVPGVPARMYAMQSQSILLGGEAIATPDHPVIVDSGTNVLLLPSYLYSKLRKSFETLCEDGSHKLLGVCDQPAERSLFSGECFAFTESAISEYPMLSFQVEGADGEPVVLEMSGHNYLKHNVLKGNQTSDTLCLAIDDTGANGLFIIGDTTMENYYTVFDRAQHTIGWAPVNKEACGNV